MPLGIFKKKLYRVKGKTPEGTYETIQESNEIIKFSDISDELRELAEQGYTYFYCEECDSNGKDCKRIWTWRPRKKPGETITSDIVKKLEEYQKLQKFVKEALGIEEPKPEDLVTTFIYYRELLRETLKAIGIPDEKIDELISGKRSSSISELTEFLNLLNQLRNFSTIFANPGFNVNQMLNQQMLNQMLNQPVLNQLQNSFSESKPVIPKTFSEELRKKASDIVNKALQRALEETAPPCEKSPELCKESEA